MNADEEIRRGEAAKILLEHDLVREFREKQRERLIGAWINSPVRDSDGREAIWAQVKALDHMFNTLDGIKDTGKMARAQAEAAKRR